MKQTTTAICCVLVAMMTAISAFVAPPVMKLPGGFSRVRHGGMEAAFFRLETPRLSTFDTTRKAADPRQVFPRCRGRKVATVVPSMVFGSGGFGGGGLGGGGKPSRGPFGLDPLTLTTIAFSLLLVLAPRVIFGAINTLFLVVTLGPLLLSVAINVYAKLNTVEAPCPVCGTQLEALKNSQNQCPSCGTMLTTSGGKFEAVGSGYLRDEDGRKSEYTRVGDSGVIDVDAIDVDD